MKQWRVPFLFAAGLFLFVVCALAVRAAQEGVLMPKLPSPPLKELSAQKNLQLGTYAALRRINEKPYQHILTTQFQFLSVDGHLNWKFADAEMRPSPDAFDFRAPDTVFDFAKQHAMPVQAHHLVWGEEKWLPDWLKNGNYSKDQLLSIMQRHIQTVGQHYSGKVREWSVVNEAFTRGLHENGLNDWWGERLGQDYIEKAFIWARQADSSAVLILNDFSNESFTPAANAAYTWLASAKARNIPVDAIGMQMHIDGNRPPKKEDVIANMRRFADLGVKVYVTEFDVTMNDTPGSRQDKEQKQAAIYHDMLRACIESTVCPSFAYLGITDKETWYNEFGTPNARPLFFDGNYQPKPAFWAMRSALNQ